ncbi:TPA: hypothetical protein ACS78C_003784 [Providencia alcalifaciens]|uniref:phage tail fiber protein n=1 Tax=Providencia alcalifaciens TaxID=126385 RepID=UPI0012B5E40E|nr:hypothetical protein [Providencia alcalifaciens]MTC37810.1 hypothetical protein [Providencia alcalifaciens]
MIYQTGTITTTAGQTKIKGTGTRWKDNLAGISEGCPISYLINNTVFMNTVLSVNSDTEINLTYPVPVAASAAKYQIATFVLDSMSDGVRKMLANQQYIQYFLRNMDTWLTQDGIVEIKTPTGETLKLESLVELKKQMDNKLDKTGGTITKNSDALNLRNISENQALFLSFQKMDGKRRGYIGAPSDKDRISIVNDLAGTALTLTEDRRATFDGKDIATFFSQQFTGSSPTTQYATPTWVASKENSVAGWVKVATVGTGSADSRNSRYLFTFNCTTPSFTSRGNFPSFGMLSLTIGNANNTSRNFEATYICLDHFGVSNADTRVKIKQLSEYQAEIWVVLGAYSRLHCSCVTLDTLIPHNGVFLGVMENVESGNTSSYDIAYTYLFATADKSGVVQSKETVRVKSTGDYPRVNLVRADDSYVSVEANPKGNANFANIINRVGGSNVAVVGIPNKSGTLVQVGDFGLGLKVLQDSSNGTNTNLPSGFYAVTGGSNPWSTNGSGHFISIQEVNNYGFQIGRATSQSYLSYRVQNNGVLQQMHQLYSTANTTKDANGNLKAASPVIKVYSDHIELNDESEGVEMEHLGVGHYLIKGVIGFNADGAWGVNNGFVIPQDHNGKNMVLIDYEVRPDGDIEVFVFHQQNAEMPERFQNKRIKYFDEEGKPVYFENHEPCDVPESRWIDMRVEMPPNSIYNQKLAEAERLAKIEAERVAKEDAEKAAREEAEILEGEPKQEQAN